MIDYILGSGEAIDDFQDYIIFQPAPAGKHLHCGPKEDNGCLHTFCGALGLFWILSLFI